MAPVFVDFVGKGDHPWLGELKSIWDDIYKNSWNIIKDHIDTNHVDETKWKERLDELKVVGLIDDKFWTKAYEALTIGFDQRVDDRERLVTEPIIRLEVLTPNFPSDPPYISYFQNCPEYRPGDTRIVISKKMWDQLVKKLESGILRFSKEGELPFYLDPSQSTGSNIQLRFAVNEKQKIVRFSQNKTPVPNIRIVLPMNVLGCRLYPKYPKYSDKDGNFLFAPVKISNQCARLSKYIVEPPGVFVIPFKKHLKEIEAYDEFLTNVRGKGKKQPKDGAGIFLHLNHIMEFYLGNEKEGKRGIIDWASSFRLNHVPRISKDHPLYYALMATFAHEIGHHLLFPYDRDDDEKYLVEGYSQWFSNLYCMDCMEKLVPQRSRQPRAYGGIIRQRRAYGGMINNQPLVKHSNLTAFIFYESWLMLAPFYNSYRFINIFRNCPEFKKITAEVFHHRSGDWKGLLRNNLDGILKSSKFLQLALQLDNKQILGFLEEIGYSGKPRDVIDKNNPYIQKNIRKEIHPDILYHLYNECKDMPHRMSEITAPFWFSKDWYLKTKEITNSIGMEFVKIPDKDYYMGKYTVTQKEWKKMMGTTPWKGKNYVKEGDDYPATYISLNDCKEFIKKLNRKEGGDKYRLPTVEEWGYACRAGSRTKYCFGNDEGRLKEYAWYRENVWDAGEKYAHKVGQKKPNKLGLYDMHGNVWEWCENLYKVGSEIRVVRGGCWRNAAGNCTSAYRYWLTPGSRSLNLGVRLARSSD